MAFSNSRSPREYEFATDMLVEDAELVRRAAVLPAEAPAARCYKHLHAEHVLQADEGCDLDFLTQRPYTAKAPV